MGCRAQLPAAAQGSEGRWTPESAHARGGRRSFAAMRGASPRRKTRGCRMPGSAASRERCAERGFASLARACSTSRPRAPGQGRARSGGSGAAEGRGARESQTANHVYRYITMYSTCTIVDVQTERQGKAGGLSPEALAPVDRDLSTCLHGCMNDRSSLSHRQLLQPSAECHPQKGVARCSTL